MYLSSAESMPSLSPGPSFWDSSRMNLYVGETSGHYVCLFGERASVWPMSHHETSISSAGVTGSRIVCFLDI